MSDGNFRKNEYWEIKITVDLGVVEEVTKALGKFSMAKGKVAGTLFAIL